MFKYNNSLKGIPKVGFRGGDSFPPCKVLVAFRCAKEQVSEDEGNNRKGEQMLVTEWECLQVFEKRYDEGGYKNWDGGFLTVTEGCKRSYVLKLKNAGALSDLNELAAMFHGVNTKNPAAMRAAGLTAKDETAVEAERVAHLLNEMITRLVSEDGTNPFMDYLFELETTPKVNKKTGNTFMQHRFSFPTDAEALAHNAAILAKLGLKIAA